MLHADDMVSLYFAATDRIDEIGGEVFNIGGGMANSLSLLELFSMLEEMLNVELKHTKLPARESDQRVFVADVSKSERLLGWRPLVSARSGLASMLEWVAQS